MTHTSNRQDTLKAELEEMFDAMCPHCADVTVNSSDGGVLPCDYHERKYASRTYPVLRMDNFMDGEWTHASVDAQSMYSWIEELLQEWDDSELTMTQFIDSLNLRVIQMTKGEYEGVPEL